MKYWKLTGAVFAVACAFAVMIAASAQAELPIILPETITEFTGKQVGSESFLEEKSGTKVACTNATGEGTVESSHRLGLFHIHFSGCTTKIATAKGTCTGLGESSGIILSLGSYHIVLMWLGPPHNNWSLGILYLVAPVHFTCTVSGVEHLFVVKAGGEVGCMVVAITGATKTNEFDCEKREKEEKFGSKYTKYLNEKEEEVNMAPLETEENSNGKEEESVENADGTIETTAEAEIMQ